jgi:predicted dehydrogenase
VLGAPDSPPPSEQVIVGGIGIGKRGGKDLACFLQDPRCRFVAIADVRVERRTAVKRKADEKYGDGACEMYRDFRELLDRQDIDAVLIATGPNNHGMASIYSAKAGKDVYCEKPCTKTISESLALRDTFRRTARLFQAGTQRRSVPHFIFAVDLARSGRLGQLTAVHAHPGNLMTAMSGWGSTAAPEPPKEQLDWDLFLGTAAWRPYPGRFPFSSQFEKGGGLTGGGCLEWGSHCVDLCQWANDADDTVPVEYLKPDREHPKRFAWRAQAIYANGCRLVVRTVGWLGLGSCPVRFEGRTGWVEVGDSGKIVLSSPELAAGMNLPNTEGNHPANHVRNFIDCVRTRQQPAANADVACQSHIACHVVNIALVLDRRLKYDPEMNEFIDNDEANRMRREALRAPWRV